MLELMKICLAYQQTSFNTAWIWILRRRVFAPKRNKAVMDEVNKLLIANFIREVYYRTIVHPWCGGHSTNISVCKV